MDKQSIVGISKATTLMVKAIIDKYKLPEDECCEFAGIEFDKALAQLTQIKKNG